MFTSGITLGIVACCIVVRVVVCIIYGKCNNYSVACSFKLLYELTYDVEHV